MRNWFEKFRLDSRSLGLFRIGLALVLILDCFYRFQNFEYLYTKNGVSPLDKTVSLTYRYYDWSFLSLSDEPFFVLSFFVLYFVILACFLVGWKTKFFNFLAMLFYVSILHRVEWVNYAGHSVIANCLFLGLFLPLSNRFAIKIPKILHKPSLFASCVLLLQAVILYFLAAVAKNGYDWQTGTAFYYALTCNMYSGEFGEKMAVWLPEFLIKGMNYATLIVEYSIALFLFHSSRLRWIAIINGIGLQLGIMFFMDLGVFPCGMMVIILPFIRSQDWDYLSKYIYKFNKFEETKPCNNLLAKAILLMAAANCLILSYNCYIGTAALSYKNSGMKQINTPGFIQEVIQPFHTYQNWAVFAPMSKSYDDWLIPVATLKDGTKYDLYLNRKLDNNNFLKTVSKMKPQSIAKNSMEWEVIDKVSMGYSDFLADAYIRALWLKSNMPEEAIAWIDLYWFHEQSPEFKNRNDKPQEFLKFDDVKPELRANLLNYYIIKKQVVIKNGKVINYSETVKPNDVKDVVPTNKNIDVK